MVGKGSNNTRHVVSRSTKKAGTGKRVGKSKASKANNQLNKRVK